MKIIAVVNQKGGVGKTTTAINVAACLAEQGQETLLIDGDPQANATSGLGIDKRGIKKGVYDLLLEEASLEEVLISTDIDWLDLVPSSPDLIGAEVELVTALSRETRLKKALVKMKEVYKFVILDCPPSLGLLTINSLTAAESVLIPIQCEYYALEGLGQLVHTVELVKRSLNPGLQIEGVVLTMADMRVNLAEQVIGEVRKFFKDKVYQTIIPRNIKLSESPGFGKPIILYDRNSRGAEAYINLTREILEKNKLNGGD
ncbi:ParA family protein [bacterium]|nr:ParA family protein [bacterium]